VTSRRALLVVALLGCSAALGSERRRIPIPSPPPIIRLVAPPPPTRPGRAALEREAFDLVNRHRRARGLPPLFLDERISLEARRHSAAMAAGATPVGHEGFYDRADELRRVMAFRRGGENVAMNHGYSDPAATALDGWLASPGHRRNIEGRYERTGVGVAVNAADEVFFTQLFVGN
jgi:uncharacterized protein YkwD